MGMEGNSSKGWILYDGSCGLCAQTSTFLARRLADRGYRFEPFQSAAIRERVRVNEEDLRRELHLLLPDGRQLKGPNAHRHLLRQFWWGYPLFLISRLPGFRAVFDGFCRWVARRRLQISRKLLFRQG